MKKLVTLMVVLMVSTLASANGLLGYWDFNGTSNDVSGYADPADAYLTGSASLVTEAGRQALKASGGGAFVAYNDKWDDIRGFGAQQLPSGPLRGSGITLSLWTKSLTNNQWKPLFGMAETGWGARLFTMDSGTLGDVQDSDNGWNPVNLWQGNDWNGGVSGAPWLAWHHILYTYDYTVQENRLYIDGVLRQNLDKGAAFNGWWAASTDTLIIGAKVSGADSAEAYIDDAAIFSGSADLADAQFLFNGGSPLLVDIQSVPEPATMTMLGLGVLALIRRK
jgi:hypothetical protein